MLGRPRALWLRLRNVPILRMLQLEEALFRNDRRSWFITNEWDSVQPAAEALVLGISGKPEQMLHVEAAQRSGVPVIKRFTGGGTVVVDSDTLFASFIVAEGALPDVRPYPEPMLAWSGELYADALQRCGVDGFAVRANDYCLSDLKFGGNAQSISGKRWLHAGHGQGRRPGGGRAGRLRLLAPSCLQTASPWAPGQGLGRLGPAVEPKTPSAFGHPGTTPLCCGTTPLRAWRSCSSPRSSPSTASAGHTRASCAGSAPPCRAARPSGVRWPRRRSSASSSSRQRSQTRSPRWRRRTDA